MRKVADSLSILRRMVSHYRLIEKLGGGAMGVLCKAEDITDRGKARSGVILPERGPQHPAILFCVQC